jgi:hypothetical protein
MTPQHFGRRHQRLRLTPDHFRPANMPTRLRRGRDDTGVGRQMPGSRANFAKGRGLRTNTLLGLRGWRVTLRSVGTALLICADGDEAVHTNEACPRDFNRNPRWSPATLPEVTAADVEAYFDPVDDDLRF